MIFCVDFSSSSFPSFRNDRKKKSERERERKGRFQKGSFPTKKKKNCRKKRPINMPSEGKLEGENARKHKLLSINKTPNNTSSLHQMSGFFARARAVLYFFSCALYFETAALLCATMTTTTMGGERKPCLPFKERIFLLERKDAFFLLFCLCAGLVVEIFSEIFFNDKREQKNSPSLPFPFCLGSKSLERELESFQQQKFKKNEKKSSREKTKIISFPHNNLTNTLSLCSSARERWKR